MENMYNLSFIPIIDQGTMSPQTISWSMHFILVLVLILVLIVPVAIVKLSLLLSPIIAATKNELVAKFREFVINMFAKSKPELAECPICKERLAMHNCRTCVYGFCATCIRLAAHPNCPVCAQGGPVFYDPPLPERSAPAYQAVVAAPHGLAPAPDNPLAPSVEQTARYPILSRTGDVVMDITVPKGMIDELKIYFSTLEQTKEDFALLRNKTKLMVSRLSIPESLKLQYVTYVPLIVFHDYKERDQVNDSVEESIRRRSLRTVASDFMIFLCIVLGSALIWFTAPNYLVECDSVSDHLAHMVDTITSFRYPTACLEEWSVQVATLHDTMAWVYLDCRGFTGYLSSWFTYIPFGIYACTDFVTVTFTMIYTFVMTVLLALFIIKHNHMRCLHGVFEECLRYSLVSIVQWYSPNPNHIVLVHCFIAIFMGVAEMVLSRKPQALLGHMILATTSYASPIVAVLIHLLANAYLTNPFSLVFHLSNCSLAAPLRLRLGSKAKYNNQHEDPYKTRPAQWFFGLGSLQYRPVAYSPNSNNERIAIEHRVMKDTAAHIKLDTVVCNAFFAWIRKYRRFLVPFKFVKSVSFQTYIKFSNASGSVKRQLIRTKKELDDLGIDENTELTPQQIKKWTVRKAFVKVENNMYRNTDMVTNKAPRLIQGAQPEFIVLVGPWIMALQKKFKKSWSQDFCMCYTSGLSSLEAAQYITHDDSWTILEDDVGAWDASVAQELCSFEVAMSKWFGAPRAVLQLMRGNVNTIGYTSKGHKYTRLGMRKSGDPYTSLYNTMWNGLIHFHIYCIAQNKTPQEASFDIRMLLQGDDSLIVYRRTNQIIPWKESMNFFGFDAIAIFRDHFHECEFCSNLLYMVKEGWVFGPKIGRILGKLAFYVNPPKNVSSASLVRGTALGLMSSCHHIPYLREYLDRILVLTKGVQAYRAPGEEWKLQYIKCTTTPLTMFTVYDRYGVANRELRSFKNMINACELGIDITDSLYRVLIDREVSIHSHY